MFKRFDYGPLENVKIYKSKSPPVYDLFKIKVPVHVYYATNDVFVTPEVTGRRVSFEILPQLFRNKPSYLLYLDVDTFYEYITKNVVVKDIVTLIVISKLRLNLLTVSYM